MLRDEIIEAIKESGFDEYREISSSDLNFDESVFASCAENKCGNYGSNYSCPPLSGDLKENQARFLKYDHGIIINKIVDLGEFYENYKNSGKEVKTALDHLRELLDGKPVLIAGAGGYNICKVCASKTNEPCRFPEKRRYSMEGSGMDIVKMSLKFNMTYNAGNHKIGFFMIVMY